MTNSKQAKTGWAWVTATFFGIGYMPGGPGTWAALTTTAIWYAAARTAHAGGSPLVLATLIAAVAATLIGIPAAGVVERESGKLDPGFVVIDEVAGQLTALLFVPSDIGRALLALALFRVFDILKPAPVRQLERLHGGLGIMMDDVAAGLYALLIGLIVHHWW
ncbi:MAG TPA: phosphatidylglycerophosphatase A [Acidobacteriaceae bacterium]|nr:phosphatidylglycerophosphatase A [Acidobacteriaceae bacterium]